jgi:Protein of unknown function (DUF1553)/Protein of unknown function (DUF1549)
MRARFRPPGGSLSILFAILLLGSVHTEPTYAEEGARHWAFVPLTDPAVPPVQAAAHTPVDAFVLARLEAKGLTFAPPADRYTLLRRATLDLLGLPPTPAEIDAFLADPRDDAYERLLDRLLASPQFGERWGRHWLDAVGYADVTGTDNDATIIRLAENRWLYRDYVVRAFNDDRPWRRFLLEQIAGDELADWRTAPTLTPEVREQLIATGFLRTAADDTDENELNTLDIRYGVLHRTIETVATNLLALTVGCARCHDHKYEPIPQPDYYRFEALFQPALNPHRWKQPKERQVPGVGATERAEVEGYNAKLQPQIDGLTKRKAAVTDPMEKAELERELARLNGQRRRWENLQAAFDTEPPTPTHLLKRGVFDRPGAEVAPGFFAALTARGDVRRLASVEPVGKTSGRRLALAGWLTDAKAPAGALVLRVRVNRVWQQLFGRGLVETSDNFGLTGARPTHPELLDWLAAEFDGNGQRLKPLLRLLMTSAVYRQASAGDGSRGTADPRTVDPDNRLLWRMPLRRLEAEAVRDSLLRAAATLDPAVGGPPVPVEARPDGTFVARGSAGTPGRRSLYLLARRNYHETLLGVFDQPNLTVGCTQRARSVVVGQALTLLNAPFVQEQAGHVAERVLAFADSAERRVESAFLLVLCRPPTPRETALGRELVQEQAALSRAAGEHPVQADRRAVGHLCHMLLNTSEFLYVP